MKAKCTLSVLLSLLLTFALPFYAAAAPAEVPTITVETKTEEVNAGDEVTLAVAMENNPGVNGFEFEIVYDSDKLELTDIATSFKHDVNGKEMNIPYWNGSYVPNTATGKILFAAADAVTDDGTMFTVTFAVKQDAAAGAAVVSIKCVMLGVKGTDNSNLYMNAECVAGGVTIADNGTGGSTTGGSTTGGSTTGGSTTGGSTTGGNTTGGNTTGAITVSDIGIGKDAYSVTGHTVTVNCEQPCRLGYLSNGQYIAVEAVANGDGTYSYEVPENVDGVLLVVKGDANGDGKVTVADILQILAYTLDTGDLDAAAQFAANVDGNDSITVADILSILAHTLDQKTLEW